MAQSQRAGPFDTLQYAKQLEQAGFTRQQAEIQAETFYAIVQDQLISKRDLSDAEKTLQLQMETIRKEVTLGLAQVKKDLTVAIEKVRSEAKDTENKLTLEIEKVRAETEKVREEIAINSELLRRDLKIWMGGMLVVAVGALSTIMAVLAHIGHA